MELNISLQVTAKYEIFIHVSYPYVKYQYTIELTRLHCSASLVSSLTTFVRLLNV
jgi:hypothetical protein